MTYNPEATRSKLVEGIPFLFFLSFSSSPVTCHIHQRLIRGSSPVTCHIHHRRSHVTIHPRSHVTNIPWSHVTNIPGHMSHSSSRSHVTFIRGSSGAHPGAVTCHTHHPTMSHSSIIHATLFFSIKNLSFIPFFIVMFIIRSLSSFGHISLSLSLSHSIHLD